MNLQQSSNAAASSQTSMTLSSATQRHNLQKKNCCKKDNKANNWLHILMHRLCRSLPRKLDSSDKQHASSLRVCINGVT